MPAPRLLLPPSEAKTPGGRGRALGARPAHPLLGPARAEVTGALARLLDGPGEAAAAALQLPPGAAAAALRADRAVLASPTRQALDRYAGVVYQGLDAASLSPAELRVAGRTLLVMSGLLGVVRADEPVPDYRVPAAARLPGIGALATFWRRVLAEVMPALLPRTGLIVDLRSSDYAAMWRPVGPLAERVVAVRVLSPLPRGGWGVVSAASKHAKGRLARAVVRRLAAGEPVAGADDLGAAWVAAGGADAEPVSSGAGGKTVVLRTSSSRLPGSQ